MRSWSIAPRRRAASGASVSVTAAVRMRVKEEHSLSPPSISVLGRASEWDRDDRSEANVIDRSSRSLRSRVLRPLHRDRTLPRALHRLRW